eukprot:403340729
MLEQRKDFNFKTVSLRNTMSNLTIEDVKKKKQPENFIIRRTKFIGKGSFGVVYAADLFTRTKEKIAIKVINRGRNKKISQKEIAEIEIMMNLDNPFLNKLIDYYFQENKDTQEEELVLLQPRAMSDFKRFLEGMPEKQAIEFLAQLVIGLKAMHDKKVMHRDFNPKNILVFENDQPFTYTNLFYTLKISDFGCSRILEPQEYYASSMAVGKVSHMAPELINEKSFRYNPKVDVYALGITAFEMITGRLYNAGDISSRKFDREHQYSAEFIDLLFELCSLDHLKRPTIDEVINHPIIQKSKTFIKCQLAGIIPLTKPKISIDFLKDLQVKYNQVLEKFIDDLETKFPEEELKLRMEGSLQNSITRIGEVFYLMNKIREEFKDENVRWINSIQKVWELREMKSLFFQREVDDYGNIFVGLYKDGQRHYGRYYEQDRITEGHIFNGMFEGQAYQYEIHPNDGIVYYDGKMSDNDYDGHGVWLCTDGDMYCGNFQDGSRLGKGTFYYKNGDTYQGEWLENERQGLGLMSYAIGGYESGIWNSNYKHGYFKNADQDGKETTALYFVDIQLKKKNTLKLIILDRVSNRKF